MLNLKSFEDYLNESIWSDIQDRSAGDTIRKEDDIDLLDGKAFCEYLNSKYNTYIKLGIHYTNDGEIWVPILSIRLPRKKTGTYYSIDFDTEKKLIYTYSSFKDDVKNAYEQLNNNFRLDDDGKKIKIYPKHNEVITNSFFIDVIEFLLDNAVEEKVLFRNK